MKSLPSFRVGIPACVVALTAGCFTPLDLRADDISWTNSGTGAWTEASNWGGTAPSISDNAIIDNGGTAEIQAGNGVEVARLLLDNGTVTITDGSIFTLPFGTFESPGAFAIGTASGGVGTLNASGASSISGGRVRVGLDGGTGNVTLAGTSSYFGDANQDTWIGSGTNGVGSLTLNDEANWNITNDWLTVGRGAEGTVTMSGTTEMLITGGNAVIGDMAGGNATVNLSGSANFSVTNGELWIGQMGSTGTVNLSGDATMVVNNSWLAVGRYANGVSQGFVTISDNAKLIKTGTSNGNIVIGADAQGTVTVKDTGTLSSNTQIWVGEGDDANATLNVQGGTVSTGGDFVTAQGGGSEGLTNISGGIVNVGGWTKLGFNADAAGAMNITGGQLNTAGSLVVGDSGSGVLTMQNGTAVTTGDTWIGQSGPGTGVFNLQGGSYSTGGWVAVGREGAQGTLNVSGGTFSHTATGAVNTGIDGVSNLTGGNFVVLGSASEVAVVNHTGGTINNSASVLAIGETGGSKADWNASAGSANLGYLAVGFNGVGVLTISGSANYTATDVKVAVNTGGNGSVLNLNGGTLTANSITKGLGGGTVNFNGGGVKAAAASADFFAGFDSGALNVQAAGLKFDTNGFDVTITQTLAGAGGLDKSGAGALTLAGATTFAGASTVSAGTLDIGVAGALDGSAALSIAAGSTLRLENAVSLNDAIVLSLANGSTVNLDFEGVETIGQLWLNGSVVDIGTYTAAELQSLSGDAINFTGGSLQVASVPEPGTVALVGLGLAVTCAGLRRRRS